MMTNTQMRAWSAKRRLHRLFSRHSNEWVALVGDKGYKLEERDGESISHLLDWFLTLTNSKVVYLVSTREKAPRLIYSA